MSRSAAAAIVLALRAAPVAGAQPKAAPPASAAPNTGFNGVWERVGAITFDPNLPPGQVDQPPYNAEYAARYKAVLDAERAGHPMADPTAACLFSGMPRFMNLALPMEIAAIPGRVFIMAEWNSEVRRIYTDGRSQPADPDPSYNGHSVGRWDKGDLYVDTVAIREESRYAAAGSPHSDAQHVTEHLWLAGPDTLKDEITVNDPKAFTRPWVVTKTYRRQPTWEIQEYVCADNNRNPVDNGVTGAVLIPK